MKKASPKKKNTVNRRKMRLILFEILAGIIIVSVIGFVISLFFPREDEPKSIISQNTVGVNKSQYWSDSKGTVAEDIEYLTDTEGYKSSFLNEYSSIGVNPQIAKLSQNGWNLLLLNKNFILPDNYELDLVQVTGSAVRLESAVADHFNSMYLDASKEGLTLTPCSGYRNFSSQRRLFENIFTEIETKAEMEYGYGYEFDAEGNAIPLVKKDELTIGKEALLQCSVPGCSDHNAGLSVDIVSRSDDFQNTKEYSWLLKNAENYGFVLRYPKGKEKITGMNFKPYCWRFVGINAAREMNKNNLCLEEYLGSAVK